MSFASFKGLMNAVLPAPAPPPAADGEASRVQAFKRFIADLERRGGGEKLPEFPPALEWLNAPPLKLSRRVCCLSVCLYPPAALFSSALRPL
jgi:hypothetical protein